MCAHDCVSGCLTKQRSSENLRCVRRCTLRCSSAWDLHALRLSIRKETALTPPLASTNWRGRAIYYPVRLGRLIWTTRSHNNLVWQFLASYRETASLLHNRCAVAYHHVASCPEASRIITESHSFQSPAHNKTPYQRVNRSIVPQSSSCLGPLSISESLLTDPGRTSRGSGAAVLETLSNMCGGPLDILEFPILGFSLPRISSEPYIMNI